MMTNDLKQRGKRDLNTYTVTLPADGNQLTVSPFTAFFLTTVWGTDRLTRLTVSQTGLVKALRDLKAEHLRSEYIEQEMSEQLANESIGRAEVYATTEYRIARTVMDTELLSSEKARRMQEESTAVARLKAEEREHDQKWVSAPPPKPQPGNPTEQNLVDQEFNQSRNRARRELAIKIELAELKKQIDQQVAKGVFTEDQAKDTLADMEQLIRAGLRRRS